MLTETPTSNKHQIQSWYRIVLTLTLIIRREQPFSKFSQPKKVLDYFWAIKTRDGSSADKLAKNHRKVLPEWNMEGVFLSKLQPLQLPIKTSPPNNRKMAPSQVTLGLLPAQRWRPAETLRGVFGERNFWKKFLKWGILPSENAIFWKVSSQQNLDLFSSSSTKEFDRYMDKSISEYISE